MKDFLFHSTFEWRMGFLLKSRVSEIHVKRIRVNQGVGVYLPILILFRHYMAMRWLLLSSWQLSIFHMLFLLAHVTFVHLPVGVRVVSLNTTLMDPKAVVPISTVYMWFFSLYQISTVGIFWSHLLARSLIALSHKMLANFWGSRLAILNLV